MNEKRVLICNEAVAAGGIGTYTLTLVEGLQAAGWQVGLVATHGPGELFGPIAQRADFFSDLSSLPLGMNKVRRLEHAVVSYAPAVLLLNHCSLAHYVLPRLPQAVKPVAVLHSDGALYYETAALFQGRIFRWIAPAARLEATMRRYLASESSARIRTIPHGIGTTECTSRLTRPSIAFVGNVGRNKGVDLLPAIFESIAAEVPDAVFRVIGDGDDRAWLQAELERRRLRTDFLGRLEPSAARAKLAECDLLLLPTRGEGFGLVIAEAMMAGVLPIVTRLAGVTDTLVEHDKTGVLVAPEDVGGFAHAASSLLKDPITRNTMAQLASKVATTRFSLERMVGDYVSLFEESDDRLRSRVRGSLSWGFEIGREMVGRNPDGSLRIQKRLRNMVQTRSPR